MLTASQEKKILQIIIVLACLVPLSAGLAGVLQGVELLGGGGTALDNHFRYLSGLLLGIGIGFASAIPHIEQQGARVQLLTSIVVVGGVGRLWGIVETGVPNAGMFAALIMELIVTPFICLWQWRVAKRFRMP